MLRAAPLNPRKTGMARGVVCLVCPILADGAVSHWGAVYYSTASPKLPRLNTVAGVFEFEVDADGNAIAKVWEWK